MDLSSLIQYLASGLTMGSIYALVALGFAIIYNASDVVNFLQGEFVMLGGMVCVTLIGWGLPYWSAFVLAALFCFLFGIAFERAVIHPMKNASTLNVVIVTIGASIFTRGGAMLVWGKDARTLAPLTQGDPVQVLGAVIMPQTFWILGVTVVLAVLFWLFYTRTYYGRAMRACAENRTAAAICGIDARAMVMAAFGISGLLGGIGGILIAPISLTSYDIGLSMGLKGFAAGILGGLGKPSGAIVGGLVLGILEALGAGYVSSNYKNAIAFVVLLLVLFAFPNGIMGRKR